MSIIETFLNEFMGIPGVEFAIVNPSTFTLVDKKSNNIYKHITFRKDGNNARFTYENPESGQETILSVGSAFFNDYTENKLIIAFLSAMCHTYLNVSKSVEPCTGTNTILDKYRPSLAYVNIAVRLGVILCQSKFLKSVNYYVTENEGNVEISTEIPADHMLALLDRLEILNVEYDSLKVAYDNLCSMYNFETKRVEALRLALPLCNTVELVSLLNNSSIDGELLTILDKEVVSHTSLLEIPSLVSLEEAEAEAERIKEENFPKMPVKDESVDVVSELAGNLNEGTNYSENIISALATVNELIQAEKAKKSTPEKKEPTVFGITKSKYDDLMQSIANIDNIYPLKDGVMG